MDERCENCRWWLLSKINPPSGGCHCMPPTIHKKYEDCDGTPVYESAVPMTCKQSFCSKFTPKNTAPTDNA